MTDESSTADRFDNYDTTINVIGGIKDCDVIYRAIDSYFSNNDSLR